MNASLFSSSLINTEKLVQASSSQLEERQETKPDQAGTPNRAKTRTGCTSDEQEVPGEFLTRAGKTTHRSAAKETQHCAFLSESNCDLICLSPENQDQLGHSRLPDRESAGAQAWQLWKEPDPRPRGSLISFTIFTQTDI